MLESASIFDNLKHFCVLHSIRSLNVSGVYERVKVIAEASAAQYDNENPYETYLKTRKFLTASTVAESRSRSLRFNVEFHSHLNNKKHEKETMETNLSWNQNKNVKNFRRYSREESGSSRETFVIHFLCRFSSSHSKGMK